MLGAGVLGQAPLAGLPTEAKVMAFINASRISNGVLSTGVNNLTFPECPVGSEVMVGVLTPGVAAVAFVAQTKASGSITASINLAYPAGSTGDLLMILPTANAAKTFNVPSGFIRHASVAPGSQSDFFYRVADGSEGANVAVSITSGTANLFATMVRLSGVNTSTPIDVLSFAQGASGTSLVLPGVTVTNNNTYLFSVATRLGATATMTQPGTMTSDFTDLTTQTTAGAHETAASGATGTRTWTWTGASVGAGALIAINPVATSGIAATLAGFTQKSFQILSTGGAQFTVLERTFIIGDPASSFALTDNGPAGSSVFYEMASVYNHTAVGASNSALKTVASTTQTVSTTTAPPEALAITFMASESAAVNQPTAAVVTSPPGFEFVTDQNQNSATKRSTVLGAVWAKRTPALTSEAFTGALVVSSADAWTTIPFASGGTTYTKNLSVVTTSNPVLTRVAALLRTLSAVTTSNVAQAIASTLRRTLSPTTTSNVTITKQYNTPRTLSVTTTSNVTMTRQGIFSRALSVVVTSNVAQTVVTTYRRTLSAVTTSNPTLSKVVSFFRTLSVTTTSNTTLTPTATDRRTLSATTTSNVTLTRTETLLRTLSAVTTSNPTLSKVVSFFRTLSVTTTSNPTMTRTATLRRTLSPTTTSNVTLSRALQATRTLAATTTSNVTQTVTALLRRTLSPTTTSNVTMTKQASLNRTLPVTTTSNLTLTPVQTLRRTLVAVVTSNTTMTRVANYFRSLSATTTSNTTLTPNSALRRNLSATTTSNTTVTQQSVLRRTLSVVTTSNPVIGIIQFVYAALPRIIRVDGKIAFRVAGRDYIIL